MLSLGPICGNGHAGVATIYGGLPHRPYWSRAWWQQPFRSVRWTWRWVTALVLNDLTAICLSLGQEVALYVKKHFAKELVKLASYKSKCYKEALEECFIKMDELMETKQGKEELAQFQKDSFAENAKSFAGCTATVILVTKTEVICANAGDSRTVLAKNGIAVDLSVDHKPDDVNEMRRI